MSDSDVVSSVKNSETVARTSGVSSASATGKQTTHTVVTQPVHVLVEQESAHVVTVGPIQQVSEITGDTSYVRPDPVPTSLGGVTAGTVFTGSVQDALDLLLYPYQAPAFTSFGFTQTSPLEVGASIAAGTKTFTWGTSNSSNVEVDSISIDDITGATNLHTGGANDGSEALAVGAISKATATSHVWRITGTNTNASTFTRDFTVSWYWRRFYGESTNSTADETLVEGLRVSGLSTNFTGTFSFVGGGYKYIAYPTVWGLKTTFKDTATNLDVAMQAATTVSITNGFGIVQNYYVHRTLNQLGGAINIAVS